MTAFIWPLRTKDVSQYRRIDEGWDLQGLGPSEEDVLAVADGTVFFRHDPADPAHPGAHFGDPYPLLVLDVPDPSGPAIYYGHVHPEVAEGTHVRQGDKIATTTSPGGGLAPNRWLEIGWWDNKPTGNGQAMHDALINAPIWEEDVPALDKTDLDEITTIVRQQFDNEIAAACQPGGTIYAAVSRIQAATSDNLNAHSGILVNTIAKMLGFNPPVPNEPSWPVTKGAALPVSEKPEVPDATEAQD